MYDQIERLVLRYAFLEGRSSEVLPVQGCGKGERWREPGLRGERVRF